DADGLPLSPAYNLVSNDVDVDRIDYMLRDGQQAGLISEAIITKIWEELSANLAPRDFEYRIDGVSKSAPGFAFKDGALDALELLLYARHNHYRQIAFHPVTRLSELLWIHAVENKLREVNKTSDPKAVKKQLLKWFTRSNDQEFRREFSNVPEFDAVERL